MPGFNSERLPDNFYVIATINTADRSLVKVGVTTTSKYELKKINSDYFIEE